MQPDLIDRLRSYLAKARPEQLQAAVSACTPMATGWENEMVRLDLQDGRQVALRLYPGDGASRKAERESQGLRALYALGYAVPQVYWAEVDPAPLGKPFMLMEYVAGQVMMDTWLQRDPAGQRRMVQTFVGLLAELHCLDWHALRRPDDAYTERYLAGDRCAFVDLELDKLAGDMTRLPVDGLLPVLEWLRERRQQVPCPRPAIVHWDFHPQNILLRADDTPVVIDWTQVRLSDPRFDLAWTLMLAASHIGPELRDIFVQGYAGLQGEVAELPFFEVYCCLKRLHTVAVMFAYGPERLGMRPEAVATITQLKPAFRAVYRALYEHTNIQVPTIEQMLST